MVKMVKWFKSLFERKAIIVKVMDYENTRVSKDMRDDILLSMVDLAKEKPQVIQYALIRLQQHMADLERIEFPKNDSEMSIYAAKIMAIIAQVRECKHMISIPSKAADLLKKKEQA